MKSGRVDVHSHVLAGKAIAKLQRDIARLTDIEQSYIDQIHEREVLNGELSAELAAAKQQTDKAQSALDDANKIITNQDRRIHDLIVRKFAKFSNEECWIYQGDGYDNLQSLSCPVVISAPKLMELEAAKQQLAEADRPLRVALQKIVDIGDDYGNVAGELARIATQALYDDEIRTARTAQYAPEEKAE